MDAVQLPKKAWQDQLEDASHVRQLQVKPLRFRLSWTCPTSCFLFCYMDFTSQAQNLIICFDCFEYTEYVLKAAVCSILRILMAFNPYLGWASHFFVNSIWVVQPGCKCAGEAGFCRIPRALEKLNWTIKHCGSNMFELSTIWLSSAVKSHHESIHVYFLGSSLIRSIPQSVFQSNPEWHWNLPLKIAAMPSFGLAFLLSRLGEGARGASALAKRANLMLPRRVREPVARRGTEEPPTPPGWLEADGERWRW